MTQPIDEAELKNRFKMMAARANKDAVYALSMPVELMSIVEVCKAQAVTAALKTERSKIDRLVALAERGGYEKRMEDEKLAKLRANELSKWEEAE